MLIAHLSDLHIDAAGSPNTRRLQLMLASLARVRPRPELLVITGDLTQDGRPAQYEQLRELLRGCGPYLLVAGNHDDASLVHRVFPEASPPQGGALRRELGALRLLLVDSSVARQDHGVLGGRLLQDMAAQIDREPKPTLLAMHHPPVPAQVPALEGLGLRDVPMFAQWVVQRGCIAGIFAGHYHEAQFASLAQGCPVIVAPSVAPPRIPDFFALSFRVEHKPAAGILHLWKQQRLSSHLFMADAEGFIAQ